MTRPAASWPSTPTTPRTSPFWRGRGRAPGLAGARPRARPPAGCRSPLARDGPRGVGARPLAARCWPRSGGACEAEPPEVRERVTPVRGELQALDLGRRFPLVLVAMNTLQVLTEPADRHRPACAASASTSAEGGELIFDVALPDVEEITASMGVERSGGQPPRRRQRRDAGPLGLVRRLGPGDAHPGVHAARQRAPRRRARPPSDACATTACTCSAPRRSASCSTRGRPRAGRA